MDKLPLNYDEWNTWVKRGPEELCERCGDPRRDHKMPLSVDVAASGSSSGKARYMQLDPKALTGCNSAKHFCFCVSFVEPGECICMFYPGSNPRCRAHAESVAGSTSTAPSAVLPKGGRRLNHESAATLFDEVAG